jgi:hypothetical protein
MTLISYAEIGAAVASPCNKVVTYRYSAMEVM